MNTHLFDGLGFSPADILLPKDGTDMTKWAVIACDQFTSEPEYWQAVAETVGDAPSALRLILPEAHLNDADVDAQIAEINASMKKYLADGIFRTYEDALIYVERTQTDGRVRHGLIGKVDLDCYDFTPGSGALIRATEGTVLDRIPPRVRVRKDAPIELPHIMVLIDDPEKTVIEPLTAAASGMQLLYDFDLMQGGGHIRGWLLNSAQKAAVSAALNALKSPEVQEAKYGLKDAAPLLYAMGDGNHSLATAKTAWENIKKTLSPEEIEVHPARYALCEIENIHDDGIVFEPIHRVIFANQGQSGMDLVNKLVDHLGKLNGKAYLADADAAAPEGAFVIPYITGAQRGKIIIEEPENKLEVGALQAALDIMVKEEKVCDIDYIHGTAAVEKLSVRDGNAGFMLPPMDKFMLFPAVAADGALPRKTFSMGEANEKRYYIESRYIAK